jgi:hypothetical protein
MNFLPMFTRPLTWLLCGGLLGLCLVLADVAPASAAETPRSSMVCSGFSSPPLAAAWYRQFGRRDRVVQLCVLTGALALFVIMKKLAR